MKSLRITLFCLLFFSSTHFATYRPLEFSRVPLKIDFLQKIREFHHAWFARKDPQTPTPKKLTNTITPEKLAQAIAAYPH